MNKEKKNNKAITKIIHTEILLCYLLGQKTSIYIIIDDSYKTEIRFMCNQQFYTFEITDWMANNIDDLIEKFHLYCQRDKIRYGTFTVKEFSGKIFFHQENTEDPLTCEQKINCIIQSCKDIIRCLNKLAEYHYQSLLEYAVIYNNKLWNKTLSQYEKKCYSKFITTICCSCIIKSNFVCPNIDFKVVEFK